MIVLVILAGCCCLCRVVMVTPVAAWLPSACHMHDGLVAHWHPLWTYQHFVWVLRAPDLLRMQTISDVEELKILFRLL